MGILPTSAKLEFPTLVSVQAGECAFQSAIRTAPEMIFQGWESLEFID
jgi:hypothetical protein